MNTLWAPYAEAFGIGVYLLDGWAPAPGEDLYVIQDEEGDLCLAPRLPRWASCWIQWRWPVEARRFTPAELAELVYERWALLALN